MYSAKVILCVLRSRKRNPESSRLSGFSLIIENLYTLPLKWILTL